VIKEVKPSITVYIIFGILLLNTTVCKGQTIDDRSVSSLQKQFTSSQLPVEYRPTMRYWWFGGAVTYQQLLREMSDINAKGSF